MQVRFKLLDGADSSELEMALMSAVAVGEITIKPKASGAGAGLAEVIVIALIGAGGAILAGAVDRRRGLSGGRHEAILHPRKSP